MSEFLKTSDKRSDFRWQLLTTVSALAFLNCSIADTAHARDDSDAPTVWIELGGQLERIDGGQTPFAPSFFDAITEGGLKSPLAVNRPARYSNGLEGKFSFTPKDSTWVFSGSVRYGRTESDKFLHQQTPGQVTHFKVGAKYETKTAPGRYAETNGKNPKSYLIADFQVGKDVGLGMFGASDSSTISLGLRFAQFSEKSAETVRARPDVHLVTQTVLGKYQVPLTFYHQFFASAQRSDSFRGLGPSISFNSSQPLAGDTSDGGLSLDWGVNAAVLFGKQKTKAHHQSSGEYHHFPVGSAVAVLDQLPTYHGTSSRDHGVAIPNLGGFAAASFVYSHAKLTFGYRADFFLGAVDGGIDTRKTYDRNFYGPFATISIGLGG